MSNLFVGMKNTKEVYNIMESQIKKYTDISLCDLMILGKETGINDLLETYKNESYLSDFEDSDSSAPTVEFLCINL